MPSDLLRILLLDDSEDDAERLLAAVRHGGFDPTFKRVSSPEALRAEIEGNSWDLVMVDHSLPGFNAVDAAEVVRSLAPTLPLVALADSIEEESAVAVMNAGATDYILRRNLARLVPIIRRELRDTETCRARNAAEAALRESEERFRCLSVSSPVGIFLADTNGECVYVNPRCRHILGATMGRLIGRSWLNPIHPDDRESVWQEFSEVAGSEQEYVREFRLLREDGTVVWVRFRSAPMRSDHREMVGHVGTMEDITKQRQATHRLAMQYAITRLLGEVGSWDEAAPRLLRAVCDTLGLRLAERWRIDREANVARWVDTYFAVELDPGNLGSIRDQVEVRRGEGLVGQAWETGTFIWAADALDSGESPYPRGTRKVEIRGIVAIPVKQGEDTIEILVFASAEPLHAEDELLMVITALMNQIGQFLERKRLQAEFLQAQKMEAIGMLAGGVAHDFNNLLLVVMGYSDLMLQRLKPGDALYSDIEEIRKAGQRAATLTRQLLAFTRKSPGERQVLNLNEVLGETLKMLRRVLGKRYELLTELDPELGLVRADPGQIDQVLMNMAVNARDAMPAGGKLTISTRNMRVAEASLNGQSLPPGNYAILTFADTGTGMSEDVKARIFEPFFTTKAKDKGTGLGLATCLSIVKESGGTLDVESTPGKGTRFVITLPSVEKSEVVDAPVLSDEQSASQFAGHGEYILVVDDEPALRDLTALVLTEAGYMVQQAANGQEAMALLLQSTQDELDLLLTDVDMPQMNGYQLAEYVAAAIPKAKIVLCSGHSSDAVPPPSDLLASCSFVTKPYTPQALVRTIRQVLDESA